MVAVVVTGLLLAPGMSAADPPGTVTAQGPVDTGLCGFPVQATLFNGQASRSLGPNARVTGFAKLVLTNLDTGQSTSLGGNSPYYFDSSGGFHTTGHGVWVNGTSLLPYYATDGPVSIDPNGVFSAGGSRVTVIDPCAEVGPQPDVNPAATPAPWGLPTDALSHIAYAGLIPLVQTLVRHDHVHLDIIIDGRSVTVPAGIGMAEPVDTGPCPPGNNVGGDCAAGDFFEGGVVDSPLHTHSASGIIHIESDRPGTFTLGQFFDEWGVRLNQACIGGYCAGNGKEMRVYVNGTQVTGDPRDLALIEHQEIAVIYGGAGAFNSVPSTYTDWSDTGCGGPGEPPGPC
jgi:hypothetical protein